MRYNSMILTELLLVAVLLVSIRLTMSLIGQADESVTLLEVHNIHRELIVLEALVVVLMLVVAFGMRRSNREKAFLQNYGNLLEDSSSCVIGIDDAGIIYYANRSAVSLLGYETQDSVVGGALDAYVASFRDTVRAEGTMKDFFSVIKAHSAINGECQLASRTGVPISVDFRASRLSNPIGSRQGYVMTFTSNAERKATERLRIRENLLQSRTIEVSKSFLAGEDIDRTYQIMLDLFLYATDSEFGFVGEVLYDEETNEKYVRVGAITNIAWNQATRALYKPSGMIFRGLDTLFGRVITTEQPVISNSPSTDPRRKGVPHGHPPLRSFLGIPFMAGNKIVGMIGLANNPDGYDESMVRFLTPTISACSNVIVADGMRRSAQRLTEMYRTLLNDAPIMYLFVRGNDDDFAILDCNSRYLDMTGYVKSEIIGKNLLDLVSDERGRTQLATMIASGKAEPSKDHCHWLGKSGNIVTTQCTVVPEFDDTGAFVHAKVMLVDMSSYLSARAENEVMAREFFQIIDSVRTPIIITDARGRVSHWNHQMELLTGVPAQTALGMDLRLVRIGLLDTEAFSGYIDEALQGREYQGLSLELLDAVGKRQHLYVNITPRHSHTGSRSGLVFICQVLTNYLSDLSAHYSLQKMEAIGQLTGGIAHDFNNLLTVILGNLEYISELTGDDGEPELRSALEDSISAAHDGVGLIKNLLAFARRKTVETKVFELRAAMTGIVGLGARTLGEKIHVELRNDADVVLNIDRSMLESSILNILINARDAMDGEGRINVETRLLDIRHESLDDNPHSIPPGHWVVIRITDEGIGMDEATMQHALEPFFTTKPEGKGTGLGLSMAYGFVTQCGGHLKIDSQLGKGTIISIYLPASASLQQSQPSVAPPAHRPEYGLAGRRVLLVEDDDRVRNNASRILKDAGCEVKAVENAEMALQMLESDTFDLVFSDIVMPGKLDGRKLATLIERLYPGLPVLLASGFDKTRESNGQDSIEVLAKPYTAEQLLSRLGALAGAAYQ